MVKGLIKKFEALKTDEIIQRTMEANKDELLAYNREQMLEGKTNEGTDITPGYLSDPYFKSREAAQRYSDWKDKITPNPKRKRGTPNLYIDGTFHRSVRIEVTATNVIYESDFPQIGAKFSNIYGLGGDIKRDFLSHKLRPALIAQIRQQLKI